MAKNERLDLRVSSDQKRLLQQAANLKGETVSDFVLSSAMASADEALLDQRVFLLEPEVFDQLITRSEDVVKNRAAIDKILAIKTPWQD
jgi:uncharacterized protein (DUF1778 family)